MHAHLWLCTVCALPAWVLAQQPPVTNLELGAGSPGDKQAHHRHARARAERMARAGLRARSITVEGRWAQGADLGMKVCDLVTTESIFAAMEALEAAVTRSPAATAVLASQGEAEVLLIQVDYDTRPGAQGECGNGERTVGITLRPYHVRVGLERLGDNVLPVPRSALASLYQNVPAPLRALDPQVGLSQDKAFGAAVSVGAEANLLALPTAAAESRRISGGDALDLQARRVHSTTEAFHRSEADLVYRARARGSPVDEYRLKWSGVQNLEPLASKRQSHAATTLGAGFTLKPRSGLRMFVDAGWRRVTDEVTAASLPSERTESRRLAGRAMMDMLDASGAGFLRTALWHESARVSGFGRFSRTALQAGYAREMAFGSGPTLGIEIVAGAGRVTGTAPEADRFFGGNPASQFLYDAPNSPTLQQLPRGPAIRSFGNAQASAPAGRGGNSYWHLNTSVALPVGAWSHPLIPDEKTDLEDEEGKPVGVKRLLRTQVDKSGPSMLAATLVSQGMSLADAEREAAAAMAEVKPAVHFLVDRASLYAVRPLLLLDAAELADGAGAGRSRWIAVGAGVGLTVVTATVEAGYMRTISGPVVQGGRGAAFARIVFKNLF
jgi:hypothetical protein